MTGEKTEKATPKRRRDQRKKGNVLLSKEINTVFTLLAIFFAMSVLAPWIFDNLRLYVTEYFLLGSSLVTVGQSDLRYFFVRSATIFAMTAIPLLLVTIMMQVSLTFAQTRGNFASEAISFKLEKLNPISGIKKIFSMKSVIELIKSILKISILGYILYDVLSEALPTLPRMLDMTVMTVIAFTGDLILTIVWRAVAIFIVLAILDFFYQWWDYLKSL